MDELWMLYLEQQAKREATATSSEPGSIAVESDSAPVATGSGSARPLPFACEDPTKA
jgi:hypothetical protein